MSKVSLIGDIHFDGKSSSIQFIEFQRKFFEEQYIPYLLKNNIKTVFQLGDIFDRRTVMNMRTLYHAKKMFFDVLHDNEIDLHILVGNHDIFYLDTLEVNSPELLLREYSNVFIHTNPKTINVGTVSFDLIPWICKENYVEVHDFIDKSHSDYCLGHFEIAGFAMYKGYIAEEGLSPTLFKKYKRTVSGHYHTRSTQGNISYIGTPMEITWQDCDDPRGFEVFDTVSLQSEFIKNDYTLFHKIYYDEEKINSLEFDFLQLREKYVKIIIIKKENLKKYDNFLQQVYESGCHDVSIDENFEEFSNGVVEDNVKIEDTLSVVNSYIDSIDVNTNKEKLKSLMQRTYMEALNAAV